MAYVASMEIVTTKSKLACGGKWAYIPQCTQSQINALSFAKSGTNSLIILASVLGAFNIGSFNYIFVGKTSLHAAGSCRLLLPRKYLATCRRFASGQSSHGAFAKASVAETPAGMAESSGFPSPLVARTGSSSTTFFPKSRG